MRHTHHRAWVVAVVLQLLLLLSLGAYTAAATSFIATPLSTHVLNVTLNAPGWPTDATSLATYTAGLRSVVNTTVCGSLPSTVSRCEAFMMAVSATSTPVQVAVQASAQTAFFGAGNGTYTLFSQWAAGTNLFSLSALAGTLPTPTYSTGTYTVPCRGSQTYAFLPACAADESASTVAYVQTTSLSNLQSTFLGYLCPSTSTTVCTAAVTVTASTDNYQIVNITGTSRGVEAVLAFVADARASYSGATTATTTTTASASTIPGETVGDSAKQLSVTAVELRYRTVRATLFSTTERERTYMTSAHLTLQCEASYSMWAIALVVIPFLAILVYWYVWYRGRRRAKKHERRRIIEDETRIMQGYTNPAGGAAAAETAPPPGVDAAAAGPQWVMDENGNYYDAAATTTDTAAAGADGATYQTWVDPETGETYQYVVDNTAAPAPASPSQTTTQPQQQRQKQAAATTSPKGTAAPTYQIYTDPNTGETYQYVVDSTQAGDAAGTGEASPAAAAEADGNGSVSYQSYVDPETGEAYQYAVDAANTAAQDEPVAQEESADAAAGSYQTYVDPETGESYQYAAADAAADGEGQQYEYVDPNTGQTYLYDVAAAQDAEAAGAAEGDAAANTYVDPETGETYQYAADANAGEAYEYVDPETGETYQYEDPNAAQ